MADLFGLPLRQRRAQIYRYNDSILICSNQKLRTRYRFGRASIEYNTNLIETNLQWKRKLLLRSVTTRPSPDSTTILCKCWLTLVRKINQSNQSKSLGLIIDENLSWKAHIHEISKKVSSCIGALKRVRPFVSMHTAIKIYKALIEPHFDYCSAVWDGLTQQLSEKLQKLQNRAIRVITKSSYDTSSRLLLTSLGWDNLSSRRAKQKANLMYKCINNLAPAYLCNLFLPRIPSYDFRNAKKKVITPKTKN